MSVRPDPDPQRLLAANAAANDYYRSHLLDEPRALAYLRSRGIVAATAHSRPWTIGYAPAGWTNLRDHLRAAGFSDAEQLAAGLVTTARNGNVIDVFRDRVTFPIRGRDGQVVAFTGRDLSGREEVPKYRNTTTTAIYHKSELLYGLAEQLGDAQPAAVMLVEGPADVVAVARLRQSLAGDAYPEPLYAMAPCGTALTAAQVAGLTAAVPPGTALVVAFDADTAGQAAIDKSYQLLRDWPGPVQAIALPAGSDPASLVAAGPAAAVAEFDRARRPLVDLVLEHRLAPHQSRLDTRLAELARLGRDPATESMLIRLDALHSVAPFVAELPQADMVRLSHQLVIRLELNPLTVLEAIYPPIDDALGTLPDPNGLSTADSAREREQQLGPDEPARAAMPMGAAGFPDPQLVGHEYARVCPAQTPAATWVQHDHTTGHTAWVMAEGVADTPADRAAAQLAAEVAGRVAVLVGAQQAVQIARTAVNAHFATEAANAGGRVEQGNATIAVLTSFDGDRPTPGAGRFTVAWAGDTRAYAATGRWFAPLTVDHTLHARADVDPDTARAPRRPGDGALTASVRAGHIGVNRLDLPITQILLAGRALSHLDPSELRTAVQHHRPSVAIGHISRLGATTAAALLVRPRPEHANQAMSAARLARQDQAVSTTVDQPSVVGAQRRPALPAGPGTRPQPVR